MTRHSERTKGNRKSTRDASGSRDASPPPAGGGRGNAPPSTKWKSCFTKQKQIKTEILYYQTKIDVDNIKRLSIEEVLDFIEEIQAIKLRNSKNYEDMIVMDYENDESETIHFQILEIQFQKQVM